MMEGKNSYMCISRIESNNKIKLQKDVTEFLGVKAGDNIEFKKSSSGFILEKAYKL